MTRKQLQLKSDTHGPAFLLGQLPDLLFSIKRISDTLGKTRNGRSTEVAISKLRLLLKQYSGLLEPNMQEKITNYIQETFKSRKISRQLTRKL